MSNDNSTVENESEIKIPRSLIALGSVIAAIILIGSIYLAYKVFDSMDSALAFRERELEKAEFLYPNLAVLGNVIHSSETSIRREYCSSSRGRSCLRNVTELLSDKGSTIYIAGHNKPKLPSEIRRYTDNNGSYIGCYQAASGIVCGYIFKRPIS